MRHIQMSIVTKYREMEILRITQEPRERQINTRVPYNESSRIKIAGADSESKTQ